jgi:molecular chaperone DnaJ
MLELMTREEAYQLLGLHPGDGAVQIKRAWRQAVRDWHPDNRPDDPEAVTRVQAINDAYALLQQPAAAPLYEESVEYASPSSVDPYAAVQNVPLDPYARRGSAPYPSRGDDIATEVTVDWTEALHGVQVVLDIERWRACHVCGGLQPQVVQHCHACQGFGREIESVSLSIDVPPGVRDGDPVRVQAVGNTGLWGGEPGDVILTVRVENEHESIWKEVDGKLLLTDIPLSLDEALLGTVVRIPTPQGWKTLRLGGPVDIYHLQRVRGAGLPQPDGSVGDLWCSFLLRLPTITDSDTLHHLQTFLASMPQERLRDEQELAWDAVMSSFHDK